MKTRPNYAASRLRQWRLSQEPHLGLAKAGARVHVCHSAWCEYESGKRTPSLERAIDIEIITGGAVRLEDWGLWTKDVVLQMRRLLTARSTPLMAVGT